MLAYIGYQVSAKEIAVSPRFSGVIYSGFSVAARNRSEHGMYLLPKSPLSADLFRLFMIFLEG